MTDDEKLGVQVRLYNAAVKAAQVAGVDVVDITNGIVAIDCSPEAYEMLDQAYGLDYFPKFGIAVTKNDSLTGTQMTFDFGAIDFGATK